MIFLEDKMKFNNNFVYRVINNRGILIDIKESKVVSKEAVGNKWERQWYFKNVALTGPG